MYHRNSVNASITAIGGGTVKGVLFLALPLFILLIPFFGYGELSGLLGEDKLKMIFFRSH